MQGTYGGNTLGGKIGVTFPEPVAVEATYYTLTEYHSASNHYTAGHKGIERLVTTKKRIHTINGFMKDTLHRIGKRVMISLLSYGCQSLLDLFHMFMPIAKLNIS